MRKTVATKKAPAPAAGYAQAIVSGELIFVSGQIASDPKVGKITATTMEAQVRQVLLNIESIVVAAGGKKDSIVRCGVFLSDLADFSAMDRAFREFFGKSLPARTTVQAGLGTLRVEIDAIATRVRKNVRRSSGRQS